jgi:hypothetical protein
MTAHKGLVLGLRGHHWAALYLYRTFDGYENLLLFAFFVVLSLSALGQSPPSMVPQVLEFPGGKLHLKAYLWKPAGPALFLPCCLIMVRAVQTLTIRQGCRLPKQRMYWHHFSLSTDTRFCIPFAVVMAHPAAKHHSCRIYCVAKRSRGERGSSAFAVCSTHH